MKTNIQQQVKNMDYLVSQNIKKYRIKLGLSQQEVAIAIGVSIQQIQKYENCINRISSGKLNILAMFFKIPISDFFIQSKDDKFLSSLSNDFVSEKRLISLIKSFNHIKEQTVKNKIFEFIQVISST